MKCLALSVLFLAACGQTNEPVDEVRADRGRPTGAGGEEASPAGGASDAAGAGAGAGGASGGGGVPTVGGGGGSGGGGSGGGGSGGAAGSGSAGESTAGAAGQSMLASEPLPIGDGGFPLFAGDFGMDMASSEDDGSFHFVFAADTPVGNISTHIHNIDLTELFTSVAFEVRSSRPTTMFVASTPVIDSYTNDQEAGFTWLGTEVAVSEDFTSHDVVFVDMLPIGEGEPRPLSEGGTAIHFLLFEPGDTELWLKNIELKP